MLSDRRAGGFFSGVNAGEDPSKVEMPGPPGMSETPSFKKWRRRGHRPEGVPVRQFPGSKEVGEGVIRPPDAGAVRRGLDVRARTNGDRGGFLFPAGAFGGSTKWARRAPGEGPAGTPGRSDVGDLPPGSRAAFPGVGAVFPAAA